MNNQDAEDRVENYETLGFLIKVTEMLKSSDAIIGRNDEIFAIDKGKVPYMLKHKDLDLGNLFMKMKLVVDQDDLFGVVNIVNACCSENNILFCEVSETILETNGEKDDTYPYQTDVKNWFLKIPLFSKIDKLKYEKIYRNTRTKINETLQENADEFVRAIFSLDDGNRLKSDTKLH